MSEKGNQRCIQCLECILQCIRRLEDATTISECEMLAKTFSSVLLQEGYDLFQWQSVYHIGSSESVNSPRAPPVLLVLFDDYSETQQVLVLLVHKRLVEMIHWFAVVRELQLNHVD